MSDLEQLAKQAIEDPIRTPPPVATLVSTATRRRQRRRVAVGLVGAVVLMAGIGAAVSLGGGDQGSSQIDVAGPAPTTSAPATEPSTAPATEVAGTAPNLPPLVSGDEGLTLEQAASTPPRVLRTAETRVGDAGPAIQWRLTERGTTTGRCLEVTAVVDGAVHSRGGSCGLASNPSANAWDLEWPLKFDINGRTFLTLFGRAGKDVSTVRTSDPIPAVDADVAGAWLLIVSTDEGGDPFETVVESLDSAGASLMDEVVTIDVSTAFALDTAGLIAELQLREAGAAEAPDDASISPFFTGSARSLCVNGSLVRLFEYDARDERRAESDQITTDGQPNDLTRVSWSGSPRFFAAGNLIALHLSADAETLALLAEILGPTLSPDDIGARGSGDPPCDADFLNDPQVVTTPPDREQPAPTLTAETVKDAEALITGFIDALGRGDTAGARQMWTGYPFGESQASREFDRFLSDFAWLATIDDPQLLVVPSFAFVEASPIVTVANSGEPGVRVPSFVLSIPQDGEPQMIERLPTIDLPPNPPLSAVKPGGIVAFDVFPIEGSARAFLDEQEIGVAVDWELGTVNILLPDELPQTFTITVTFATPEIPGAFAVAYSSAGGN